MERMEFQKQQIVRKVLFRRLSLWITIQYLRMDYFDRRPVLQFPTRDRKSRQKISRPREDSFVDYSAPIEILIHFQRQTLLEQLAKIH
jgi:hypothetical protein